MQWCNGSQSDALAALDIFRAWRANPGRVRRDRFVDLAALREIDDLVKDTRAKLEHMRIPPHNLPCPAAAAAAGQARGLLYVLLFGAAYPNVFCGKARSFLSVNAQQPPLGGGAPAAEHGPVVVRHSKPRSQLAPVRRPPRRVC